ncbi:MAG TPA: cytochrome c1 [Thermohalobaculum sp.]|nr:cytochrome c1 [Thermohalobaculum sp.]
MSFLRFLAPLAASALIAAPALAAESEAHVEDISFSFEGPFGTFDEMQLQRGFQVFHEVCAACHGLKYLSFRNLGEETGPHFPEAQVSGIAALYTVYDEEEGAERPAEASDRFPEVTAANAPDLTLMAKARAGFHGPYGTGINQLIKGMGGPEYIYSLLTGYTGEQQTEAGAVLWENTAFPGGWISMPPPLSEGIIEYTAHGGAEEESEDGHGGGDYAPPPATVEQMAEDLSAFLAWTAEPMLVERKEAGFRNILVLIILAVLLYYTNRKVWHAVKHRDD